MLIVSSPFFDATPESPAPRSATPPLRREPVAGRGSGRKVGRMASEDDAALMQAWIAGDLHAFDTLYARHKGPLYRYLLRHTRDRALTDDLFQDTWGRLIAARERYQPRARFQTFLFTLAHNLFIDHCRRSRIRPVNVSSLATTATNDGEPSAGEWGVDAVAAPEFAQPEKRAEQQEVAMRIRAALDALPHEQRDVFLLYEETGLSLEDIASVTGVGTETAKSRLRYAVAKLRIAMTDISPAALARTP